MQISSQTLENNFSLPLSKRNLDEEPQLPGGLDSKTGTEFSSSLLLNLLAAKPLVSDPLSSKSMLGPLYGSSVLTQPNFMLASMFYQDQSQKVLLQSLNMSLYLKLNTLLSERTDLLTRIKKCEEQQGQQASEGGQQKPEAKRKRQRRLANQIIRLYKCPDATCTKSYGSEFSLSQHLRTKHPEKADELLGQIMKEGHN